jgi:hypothetical protein
MATQTQERRDAEAVRFSSLRRQPMQIGKTRGPRAMMNARNHEFSQLSSERASAVGSTAEHVARAHATAAPRYVTDMHTDTYESECDDSVLEGILHPGRQGCDARSEFAGMSSMGGVRYAQLYGTDSSGMREDFHSRMESGASLFDRMEVQMGHQGPVDSATAHLASGVTSGIRHMQLYGSSDSRGNGGFVERTPGSARASTYATQRARTARAVERRSHATGIMAATGSVFE